MAALTYLLFGVLFFWHIYGASVASWYISKSDLLDPWQKNAQHVIAWCLPFIGVASILHMLGPAVRRHRPGWIPLLEPVILASFLLSISHTTDQSNATGDSMEIDPNQDITGDNGD